MDKLENKTAIVFDIMRYAIHDGPGIRTLIFMKGCPLRCFWCDNPESQERASELGFFNTRCVGCGRCVQRCPQRAISLQQGKAVTNRAICRACSECTEVCFQKAREIAGKHMTVDEILKEVVKDTIFYQMSGGGITLGGGEPLMQSEVAQEFLRKCKEMGLHTAIETCGYAPWENMEKILVHTDLIHYDIKIMDKHAHKNATGVSNELILDNVKRIVHNFQGKCVIIRTPLISGFNDSEKNIRDTAEFIKELGLKRYEILAYHPLGEEKYQRFGKELRLKPSTPNRDHLRHLKKIVEEYGLKVLIAD